MGCYAYSGLGRAATAAAAQQGLYGMLPVLLRLGVACGAFQRFDCRGFVYGCLEGNESRRRITQAKIVSSGTLITSTQLTSSLYTSTTKNEKQ